MSLLTHAQDSETDANTDTQNLPKTSTIERSVMPATQWLEKKIQNSTLIQPSIYIDDSKNTAIKSQQKITLREAIEKAKLKQTGTVLSAKKISNDNSTTFKIKILTNSGIIKIIDIEDDKELHEK